MTSNTPGALLTEAPEGAITVRNERGAWEIQLPGQEQPVTYETLDDARRAAYLYAARRRPCTLIARDAYQRVVSCEYIPSHAEVTSRNSWFG